MDILIVNAQLPQTDTIIEKLYQLLSEHGADNIDIKVFGNIITVNAFAGDLQANIQSAAPIAAEVIPDVPPEEVVSYLSPEATLPGAETQDDMMLVLPSEMSIGCDDDCAADNGETSADQQPQVELQSEAFKPCSVMSLSAVSQIPCWISQEDATELCVSQCERIGEFVVFEYCGMVYKYPAESESNVSSVCNLNPQFTDTTIRVALQFADSEVTYPCLVNVVVAETAECIDSLVLGKDLLSIAECEKRPE